MVISEAGAVVRFVRERRSGVARWGGKLRFALGSPRYDRLIWLLVYRSRIPIAPPAIVQAAEAEPTTWLRQFRLRRVAPETPPAEEAVDLCELRAALARLRAIVGPSISGRGQVAHAPHNEPCRKARVKQSSTPAAHLPGSDVS